MSSDFISDNFSGRVSRSCKRKSYLISDNYKDKTRVGPMYQAEIPELLERDESIHQIPDNAINLWKPATNIPENLIVRYVLYAKEIYDYSLEQAYGLLWWRKHDLKVAIEDLPEYINPIELWSRTDLGYFNTAFKYFGKDFRRFMQLLPNKTMGNLIEHYYNMKKKRYQKSSMDIRIKTGMEPDSESDYDDDDDDDEEFDNNSVYSSVTLSPDSLLNASGDMDFVESLGDCDLDVENDDSDLEMIENELDEDSDDELDADFDVEENNAKQTNEVIELIPDENNPIKQAKSDANNFNSSTNPDTINELNTENVDCITGLLRSVSQVTLFQGALNNEQLNELMQRENFAPVIMNIEPSVLVKCKTILKDLGLKINETNGYLTPIAPSSGQLPQTAENSVTPSLSIDSLDPAAIATPDPEYCEPDVSTTNQDDSVKLKSTPSQTSASRTKRSRQLKFRNKKDLSILKLTPSGPLSSTIKQLTTNFARYKNLGTAFGSRMKPVWPDNLPQNDALAKDSDGFPMVYCSAIYKLGATLKCFSCGLYFGELNFVDSGKLCTRCLKHWRSTGEFSPITLGNKDTNRVIKIAQRVSNGRKNRRKRLHTPPHGIHMTSTDLNKLCEAITSCGNQLKESGQTKKFDLSVEPDILNDPIKLGELTPDPLHEIMEEEDKNIIQIDRELASLQTTVQLNKSLTRKLKGDDTLDIRPPQLPELEITKEWTRTEILMAKFCLQHHGLDFKAQAEVIGTKNEEDMEDYFYSLREQCNLDACLLDYEKIRLKEMESDNEQMKKQERLAKNYLKNRDRFKILFQDDFSFYFNDWYLIQEENKTDDDNANVEQKDEEMEDCCNDSSVEDMDIEDG